MSFIDKERADLLAALSINAHTIGLLLKQLDLFRDARDNGRVLTDVKPRRFVSIPRSGISSWTSCARG